MSDFKEFREIVVAFATVFNSFYLSKKDGKLSGEDAPNFFDDVPAIIAAATNAQVLGPLRVATNTEMESLKPAILAAVPALPESSKFDTAAILVGISSLLRSVAKASYEEGVKDSEAKFLGQAAPVVE